MLCLFPHGAGELCVEGSPLVFVQRSSSWGKGGSRNLICVTYDAFAPSPSYFWESAGEASTFCPWKGFAVQNMF